MPKNTEKWAFWGMKCTSRDVATRERPIYWDFPGPRHLGDATAHLAKTTAKTTIQHENRVSPMRAVSRQSATAYSFGHRLATPLSCIRTAVLRSARIEEASHLAVP